MTGDFTRLTRREALAAGAAGVAALATVGVAGAAAALAGMGRLEALRPPGALPGAAFAAACIGCFRCAEVCPPGAIRLTPLPSIDPSRSACTLCMQCGPACPTGALGVVALDDVARVVRMGSPHLDADACRAWRARPCSLCSDVCPVDGAVVLDGRLRPHFDNSKCVGCGQCTQACPVEPQAIRIRPPEGART